MAMGVDIFSTYAKTVTKKVSYKMSGFPLCVFFISSYLYTVLNISKNRVI